MDNFGDNFDDGDVDPAAEFLAREQSQLAGLEDDLNTPNVPIGITQTLSNGNNQLVIIAEYSCHLPALWSFFWYIFFLCSACFAFNEQLGSGSSFEIIDSAENQLPNTANGELSELNLIEAYFLSVLMLFI